MATGANTGNDEDDEPSTDGRLRKHRHDLGHEDHGAKIAAGTTKAIQAMLGLWIVLSVLLVAYVLIDAARPRPAKTAPAPKN